MQHSTFKIYNASAGSGKTHTLTKEYLKIVLSPGDRFSKILAITFTNKAVNEMKHRILDSLFKFGQVKDEAEAPALFLDLMKELGIDAAELRQRSKQTLKQILHNYAFFDISTIDKFTHRLIRTFAKDLKLPQNFEVVLDTDLLLDEAVAKLVHKAGTDKQLTQVLLDFALEKIDDDKSWDIAYDLGNIGKLLFRENHAEHLQNLRDKNIDDFLGLKKTLRSRIKASQESLVGFADLALQLIEQNGLEFPDFTRSYFPKFMEKIASGDLAIDFNAGWKQNFDDAVLYNKSTAEATKATLDDLHPQFSEIFNKIKHTFYELSFLKNAYSNLVPLTVLNAIQREVKNLQNERDQLSIAEFNTIISKEIRNQPAPFIYERLGEKYRHYFVDEFQDTSTLQWNNLIPLIGHALEGEDLQGNKGSLFLVGDAKQAIYRWRGGRAEQFLDLVNKTASPFAIPAETESLPTNWRSYDEVIKFNNDFFTATSPFLNNAMYNAMFVEGNRQGCNSKQGGTVQLKFIDKDDDKTKDEQYCEEVLATIAAVIEKKYGYEDICILVRGNRQGVLLADFLTQEQIPTISSESLLLNSSDRVRFLADLIGYIGNPENLEIAYNLLTFLSKGSQSRHQYISGHLKRLPELLKNEFGLDVEELKELSVYDGMERVIRQCNLVEGSDAYVTFFMDFVLETEQKEGTGIQAFLNLWEKKKGKLSISAPDNIDAVRIMTVHKSKGLEFPIVIFPFANENIYKRMDKKIWLPLNAEAFDGFEEILVTEKKEVENYGEEAARIYSEEEHKMELDALNLLYVALTRAEKALYVISEKDLARGQHKTDYYSGLFIEYLKGKGLWSDDELTYAFGELEEAPEVHQTKALRKIDYSFTHKDRSGFKILTRSGMLWDTDRETAISKGNLIHYILGCIETEEDIEAALNKAVRQGEIEKQEIDEVRGKLERIVKHPKLNTYYIKGNTVKNEKDIITAEGQIVRPDRIVINGNRATLIDYKTGKANPKYKEQLYFYADALTNMGYVVENKIIVYINDDIIPEFI
ncbi:ATP-dependent exoDNAse (exonuclease V) beta subunit (contains helicase and exonuclease domains) [Zobellia uliginosa]|uniref:DNA 3'-5' helicase n=1 Tax=Zobellia uliginosa TaxID=143224 RepID=A0ABY1KL35_9FLAO|nr:UvrD-helicase domain-containing protein [Zobellia uliginosa]SIS39108.1 ATP-dependent exoDNAse (exonuclease V) beta subunit (contains helicase and exonuclease domains) [Zobellia uliginosa]